MTEREELLIRHIESLQRQINDLNERMLPFQLAIEERISSVEAQLDEVYQIKGAELIGVEPARIRQIHQIVLEEMELTDERIFHQPGRIGRKSTLNSDELFARDVLIYVLNNKIPNMTFQRLTDMYGNTFTGFTSKFKRYLNNPIDKEVIDKILNRVELLLASQRPHDGKNE